MAGLAGLFAGSVVVTKFPGMIPKKQKADRVRVGWRMECVVFRCYLLGAEKYQLEADRIGTTFSARCGRMLKNASAFAFEARPR